MCREVCDRQLVKGLVCVLLEILDSIDFAAVWQQSPRRWVRGQRDYSWQDDRCPQAAMAQAVHGKVASWSRPSRAAVSKAQVLELQRLASFLRDHALDSTLNILRDANSKSEPVLLSYQADGWRGLILEHHKGQSPVPGGA